MAPELSDKIIGYHYLNNINYNQMKNGRTYRRTGLLPIKRLVPFGHEDLPSEAHAGAVYGLLEPEPKSWTENPEFPYLWRALMCKISYELKVILLSFELNPSDNAYIVERAHMERVLYQESKGRREPPKEEMDEAFRKYFESRVPVFSYEGDFFVPELVVFSPIDLHRLKIEWEKPSEAIWKQIEDNNW
jgi:hypothetical protein